MKIPILVTAVVVLLALGTAAQAVIVIDDFTDFMTPVVAPAVLDTDGITDYGWYIKATALGVAYNYAETGLSIYGGTRNSSYTVYGSLSGTMMTMGSGWATENNGSSSWSQSTLTYDAGGAGLNLNLTSGTKLSVDRIFDHMGNLKNTVFSIKLDDGAQTATVSKIWTSYVVSNVQVTDDFLFSSFLAQNGSLNLASIDKITLYLETDKAGDYSLLTGLTTDAVPEPSSIIALVAGLGPLLAFRRRRA